MALLDVCGISEWVKEDTFRPESASLDRVSHFNFAAREPELAVPIGVDVSCIFHYHSESRVASCNYCINDSFLYDRYEK